VSTEVQSTRTRAHIRYKNAAGHIVPGTTTITGLLNKPQLVPWANKLGLQGIDSKAYTEEKAVIGTLAHKMVTDYLLQMPTETKEFSPYQVSAAENSFLSFLEWEKGKKVEPILIEKPMVSEAWQYGGTMDIYGKVDGVIEVIDMKTGGIFDEHVIQGSAYKQLLIENGYPVDRVRILGIPRDDTDSFTERIITSTMDAWEIFKHLLDVYRLLKQLKGA
jgi:RecB family exonuclease